MTKRGRKPNTERKGYFYEKEEGMFKKYLQSDDKTEREHIFNTALLPAFTKMIESIIRRYKLYPPDEDFNETFNDTISFLMTKLNNFKPDMGYKAYSYCGTVCKNYLIGKIGQCNKKQKRNISYDDYTESLPGAINDNIRYSYDSESEKLVLGELISETINKIKDTIDKKEEFRLNGNEIRVGEALIELMTHWEELFNSPGSNKFNKSSILLFLKETTLLNAKEIREGMKKYKAMYYLLKNEKCK